MSAPLEQILRELLSERREEAVRRERSAFDEQAGASNARLVLFGAGNLGRKTLSGLRAAGIEPIAFTDNDPGLWGRRWPVSQSFRPKRRVAAMARARSSS